jgi:hypothetical protein
VHRRGRHARQRRDLHRSQAPFRPVMHDLAGDRCRGAPRAVMRARGPFAHASGTFGPVTGRGGPRHLERFRRRGRRASHHRQMQRARRGRPSSGSGALAWGTGPPGSVSRQTAPPRQEVLLTSRSFQSCRFAPTSRDRTARPARDCSVTPDSGERQRVRPGPRRQAHGALRAPLMCDTSASSDLGRQIGGLGPLDR